MTTETATTKKRTTRTLAERVEHSRAQVEKWTKGRLAKIDAKIARLEKDIQALDRERDAIVNATGLGAP